MNLSSAIHEKSVVVSIMGDIDASNAMEVTGYFHATLANSWARMIIDLGGVDFMSSAGLRAILDAHQRGKNSGIQIVLAAPRPGVHKVLQTAGFTRVLACYPTVEEALAA